MRERLDMLRARHREEAVRHGVNPRDVDLLLSDLLDESAAWLYAHGDALVDPSPLEPLLERRYRGEPLQYIRGRTEFFGREFHVDRRALIPRPETELLVEAAIARAPRGARVVDIGTGSGCIAISIEQERPDLSVTGVDVSLEALAVADLNRRRLSSPVQLTASDLLAAFSGAFDLVVSNPPYIAGSEIADLAREVRDHEPHMALTPGATGLETIERILRMSSGAPVLLEIGFGQRDDVALLASSLGYRVEEVLDDLAGIPRVVVLSAAP